MEQLLHELNCLAQVLYEKSEDGRDYSAYARCCEISAQVFRTLLFCLRALLLFAGVELLLLVCLLCK